MSAPNPQNSALAEGILGVDNLTGGEAQRVRVVLIIAVWSSAIAAFYTLGYGLMGWLASAFFNGLFVVWYAAMYLLCRGGHTRVAGVALIGGGLVHLSGLNALFVPPLVGTHIFIFLVPLFALIAIHRRDRLWSVLYTIVAVGFLVWFECVRNTYAPPFMVQISGELQGAMRAISAATTVLLIVVVFRQFHRDLHRTSELAREAAVAAQAANHAKSRFLASMSHEIRTPMNAILGYAQLLQRESGLTSRQRDYLDTIDRSGMHMLALIDDVLDMAKIEAGQASLVAAQVDLFRLLVELERMFRLRAAEKGLSLSVTQTSAVPKSVRADAGKVRQLLTNLLSNALKFTDRGGVTLRVSAETRPNNKVQLIFTVEDTGSGIEEENLALIFGAFQQTAAGSKKAGTGLGLAVSRRFARLLGGDLTATSELGVGSAFRFEFEAEVLELGRADLPQRRVVGLAASSTPTQVLVVDDVPENRAVLSSMLKVVGFSVRTAENGREALAAIQAERPDVLLLDLVMPIMDGLEVTRRLRAQGNGTPIPILIVSASALEAEREQAIEAGADDFVRKPVREADLFEKIGRHAGVEYVYTQAKEPAAGETGPEPLDATLVRSLPAALCEGLQKAVQSGDLEGIEAHVVQAERHDPKIGKALRDLADRFNYESLLDLLDQ